VSADAAPARSRRRRRTDWRLALCTALALANIILAGLYGFHLAFLKDLPATPSRDQLWSAGRPPGMTFVDSSGRILAQRGPRHGAPVRLSQLPTHVPLAFLAIEDARFYEHGALDPLGILRAGVRNLQAGETVEGGSTIAQQLARTLFLSQERTLRRKVQEAILAHRLSTMLSRDELLELYLNRIYFGDRAYGISAAAQGYFGKPATELTLGEAAILAALPRAPSRLDPTNDPAAAWDRARLVLKRLSDMNWVEPKLVQAAMAKPPAIMTAPRAGEGEMAWAYDAAASQAMALVGDKAPDLVVEITVDPMAQGRAAQIVRSVIARQGRARHARQAALVALAPDGAIRALIGGVDHDASPFNRALQAKRQPGSAFKPMVWAAALEAGVRPGDIRDDRPLRLAGWAPQNYGGGYRGAVTVQRALQLSINTVSVRLAREAGVDEVAGLARRFGLSTVPEHPGPSLALGAYEVTPLELAAAYQVLQNGGGQSRPYLVARITDARGQVLYQRTPSAAVPIYPAFEAAEMVQMMEGVIRAGTGRDAAFGRPAAGKTGTSQDYRDAWFVGFTPDWLTAVWVGNDDNRPMVRVTGGQIPAAIFRRFMAEAHRGLPVRGYDWFPNPPPAVLAEPTLRQIEDSASEDEAPRRNHMARSPDEAEIWLPDGGRITDVADRDWLDPPY
jgi:penicillin-binding protein 1A